MKKAGTRILNRMVRNPLIFGCFCLTKKKEVSDFVVQRPEVFERRKRLKIRKLMDEMI